MRAVCRFGSGTHGWWAATDSRGPASEDLAAAGHLKSRNRRSRLFADESREVLGHCVTSVIEVRRYLTSNIQQLPDGELSSSLRGIRAACRKFLKAVDDRDGIVVLYGGHPGHWAS